MSLTLLMEANNVINLKKTPLSATSSNSYPSRTPSLLTNGSSDDVTNSMTSSFDCDATADKDKLEIVSECEETESTQNDKLKNKNESKVENKIAIFNRLKAQENLNQPIQPPRNFRYAPMSSSAARGGRFPAAFFLKRRETCGELIVETVEEKEEEEEEEGEESERGEEGGGSKRAEAKPEQQQVEEEKTAKSQQQVSTTQSSYVTQQQRHNSNNSRSSFSSEQQRRLKSKRSKFRRTASSHGNHLAFRHPLLHRQQSQSAFSVTKLFLKGSSDSFQRISEERPPRKIGSFPAVVRCATALSSQKKKKEASQEKKTSDRKTGAVRNQNQRQKRFKRSNSQYVSY